MGEQTRVEIDFVEGEDPADAFRRVPGVRSTDGLVKPAYPESQLHWPTFVVFRERVAIARIGGPSSDGAWHLFVDACPALGADSPR